VRPLPRDERRRYGLQKGRAIFTRGFFDALQKPGFQHENFGAQNPPKNWALGTQISLPPNWVQEPIFEKPAPF